MASREQKEKEAKFINEHGEDISKMRGGNAFIGMGAKGPVKGGLVANAQANEGDVPRESPAAKVQHNAMKK